MKSHSPSVQPNDSSSAETGKSPSVNGNVGGIFDGGLDVYRTVTEEDYRSLFDSGLIVLDANTLLNLYRYQRNTRRVLMDILTHLKDRLWVPHHAMFEFFENRLSAIASRSEEAEQAIENLSKKSLEIEAVVRQWANRIGLPRRQTDGLIAIIRTTVADIAEIISSRSSDDLLEQDEDTSKDPVILFLTSILQDGVGTPLPDDELLAAKREAKQRIIDKRPPGWRDAGKRENPDGDYLIWHETLREAKLRKTDVLFITGDVKPDWWRKENGEARGPLPELAYEMRTIADVRLFMLRPESLFVHAETILGIRISTDAVKDAQRVTTELTQGRSYVDESTGRSYRRRDLTAQGSRSNSSYEWHGAQPPQGRHWVYAKEKMDQMYAEGRIDFTSTGRPVEKRYFDERPEPPPGLRDSK